MRKRREVGDSPWLLEILVVAGSFFAWERVLNTETQPIYIQGLVYLGEVASGFVLAGLLWSLGKRFTRPPTSTLISRATLALELTGLACWFGAALIAMWGAFPLERFLAAGSCLLMGFMFASLIYRRRARGALADSSHAPG